MVLISILIALIVERLSARDACWQLPTYAAHYLSFSKNNGLLKLINKIPFGFYLWLLIPSIVVHLIISMFDFVLVELVINTTVLLVCFGCAYLRKKYKGYLNALQRQDTEAATLYALQLGQLKTEQEGGETLGQTIAWINFRFYGAVMFWFVVLGAPGALFYALARSYYDLSQRAENTNKVRAEQVSSLMRILHLLEWLPARIVSLGYLIIGNFTQGTSKWLKHAFDFSVDNRQVVSEIAFAAEKVEEQFIGCSFEAKCMVRLVKRNMLLLMALIAVMTLFGVVG